MLLDFRYLKFYVYKYKNVHNYPIYGNQHFPFSSYKMVSHITHKQLQLPFIYCLLCIGFYAQHSVLTYLIFPIAIKVFLYFLFTIEENEALRINNFPKVTCLVSKQLNTRSQIK